jgi:hypothetical protein
MRARPLARTIGGAGGRRIALLDPLRDGRGDGDVAVGVGLERDQLSRRR